MEVASSELLHRTLCAFATARSGLSDSACSVFAAAVLGALYRGPFWQRLLAIFVALAVAIGPFLRSVLLLSGMCSEQYDDGIFRFVKQLGAEDGAESVGEAMFRAAVSAALGSQVARIDAAVLLSLTLSLLTAVLSSRKAGGATSAVSVGAIAAGVLATAIGKTRGVDGEEGGSVSHEEAGGGLLAEPYAVRPLVSEVAMTVSRYVFRVHAGTLLATIGFVTQILSANTTAAASGAPSPSEEDSKYFATQRITIGLIALTTMVMLVMRFVGLAAQQIGSRGVAAFLVTNVRLSTVMVLLQYVSGLELTHPMMLLACWFLLVALEGQPHEGPADNKGKTDLVSSWLPVPLRTVIRIAGFSCETGEDDTDDIGNESEDHSAERFSIERSFLYGLVERVRVGGGICALLLLVVLELPHLTQSQVGTTGIALWRALTGSSAANGDGLAPHLRPYVEGRSECILLSHGSSASAAVFDVQSFIERALFHDEAYYTFTAQAARALIGAVVAVTYSLSFVSEYLLRTLTAITAALLSVIGVAIKNDTFDAVSAQSHYSSPVIGVPQLSFAAHLVPWPLLRLALVWAGLVLLVFGAPEEGSYVVASAFLGRLKASVKAWWLGDSEAATQSDVPVAKLEEERTPHSNPLMDLLAVFPALIAAPFAVLAATMALLFAFSELLYALGERGGWYGAAARALAADMPHALDLNAIAAFPPSWIGLAAVIATAVFPRKRVDLPVRAAIALTHTICGAFLIAGAALLPGQTAVAMTSLSAIKLAGVTPADLQCDGSSSSIEAAADEFDAASDTGTCTVPGFDPALTSWWCPGMDQRPLDKALLGLLLVLLVAVGSIVKVMVFQAAEEAEEERNSLMSSGEVKSGLQGMRKHLLSAMQAQPTPSASHRQRTVREPVAHVLPTAGRARRGSLAASSAVSLHGAHDSYVPIVAPAAAQPRHPHEYVSSGYVSGPVLPPRQQHQYAYGEGPVDHAYASASRGVEYVAAPPPARGYSLGNAGVASPYVGTQPAPYYSSSGIGGVPANASGASRPRPSPSSGTSHAQPSLSGGYGGLPASSSVPYTTSSANYSSSGGSAGGGAGGSHFPTPQQQGHSSLFAVPAAGGLLGSSGRRNHLSDVIATSRQASPAQFSTTGGGYTTTTTVAGVDATDGPLGGWGGSPVAAALPSQPFGIPSYPTAMQMQQQQQSVPFDAYISGPHGTGAAAAVGDMAIDTHLASSLSLEEAEEEERDQHQGDDGDDSPMTSGEQASPSGAAQHHFAAGANDDLRAAATWMTGAANGRRASPMPLLAVPVPLTSATPPSSSSISDVRGLTNLNPSPSQYAPLSGHKRSRPEALPLQQNRPASSASASPYTPSAGPAGSNSSSAANQSHQQQPSRTLSELGRAIMSARVSASSSKQRSRLSSAGTGSPQRPPPPQAAAPSSSSSSRAQGAIIGASPSASAHRPGAPMAPSHTASALSNSGVSGAAGAHGEDRHGEVDDGYFDDQDDAQLGANVEGPPAAGARPYLQSGPDKRQRLYYEGAADHLTLAPGASGAACNWSS